MKKGLGLLIALLIGLSMLGSPVGAAGDYITVKVIGELVEFDDQPPIIIDGRTLVPIRAVCEKIGATVAWDASTETVSITSDSVNLKLKINSQTMIVNDESRVYLEVPPQIYNGRTLLPIRAVVEALGCDVQWDAANQVVIIEPAKVIMATNLPGTQIRSISNWVGISPVQQFAYRNEGLAYAYVSSGYVIITTPTQTINIEMQYPKLGDVIADEDGYFYMVWGKDGTAPTEQTVFITKYSPEGIAIMTTGFTGESIMGTDGNTKNPFSSGNCVSAIGDGYLMVNYARLMYNGHQSNSVIGVNIADMSPVKVDSVWNIPYTSHSFNQSVIWSKLAGAFVYADHGDAYDRGLNINSNTGEKLLFHFYLAANANYNMNVVNKTFAQLGNLAETSRGVALVGASAKSINESANQEKQNLFVQIFDPLAPAVNPSMFIGGTTRSGATATDINDNKNTPLTNVTDYGVHWLTDYTDTDVIAPQVVTADDRLVILWATTGDTFYMVLSATGDVIIPATSLGGLTLNSYERPIYHDGAVCWAAVSDGRLKIESIAIR